VQSASNGKDDNIDEPQNDPSAARNAARKNPLMVVVYLLQE
jgi:hypothetical protein